MRNLLFLAFLEGSTVMALELLTAKMIAPLYGASLYVWSSIIGVTLAALAVGYFTGGKVSEKFSGVSSTLKLIFAVAIILGLLSVIAPGIVSAMSDYSIRTASLLSALALLGVPMILLGMVPPLIIASLTNLVEDSGKIAGLVYAVSTIGGICATLLLGFFILPAYGLKAPLLIIGVVLMVFAFAGLIRQKKLIIPIIGIVVMVFIAQAHFKKPQGMKVIKIVEQLESMYGQINIIDNLHKQERILVINNITQTLVNLNELDVSQMGYVHNLAIFASMGLRTGSDESRALLCGLGGGSIMTELTKMGFNGDAVEIDRRMPELGVEYFEFDKNKVNIFIDDARHFLRKSTEQYDLIVIDLLTSEVQPSHVFTVENFNHLKQLLTENGILIINFQGYMYGEEGKASRSILKTLLSEDYKVNVFFNPEEIREIVTDIFFISSIQEIDFSQLDFAKINDCCRRAQFTLDHLYKPQAFDLSDAVLLTDDNGPILDLYSRKANEDWRSDFVREYQIWTDQNLNVPLF